MFLEMLKTEIFWAIFLALFLLLLFAFIIQRGKKQILQQKSEQQEA